MVTFSEAAVIFSERVRWKAAARPESAAAVESSAGRRGRGAIFSERLSRVILQKQGVEEGWTPEPAGREAMGIFRARFPTRTRTKGQGSMIEGLRNWKTGEEEEEEDKRWARRGFKVVLERGDGVGTDWV